MIAEGSNGGVQGILALQGESGVKFVGWALGWKSDLSVKLFDDAGRGDDLWGNFLALSSGGDISVQGETRLDGQPIPSEYKGERGNLTLNQAQGVSATFPVMVVSSSFVKKDLEQDLWKFVHVCRVVGAPAFTGWSGTNAAGVDSFADKELWEGLSKLVDPNGLLSGATQRWRVFGLDDDDATEKAKIDEVLAAIALPYPTMKIKTGTFTRLSTSVCLITVQWSLTNSQEDVTNPRTDTTIDPNALTSRASVAAINAVPADPTGDNFVLRQTTSNELNDQNTLKVAEYGKRSTKDDVEFPGSIPQDDPYDLEDEATVTKETASSTPPSVPAAPLGQHVKTISEQLTADNHWKHTFEYANTNSVQKVEFGETDTQEDPSDLVDEDRATIVNGSSTPPATPTPTPLELKLRRRVSKRIGGTPEKWKHTFEFNRRTTQDDVEMENSDTKIDPFEIDAGGTITQVTGSATPPSTPAAPSTGSVFVDSVTRQIHDTKFRHTFFYGPLTSADREIFPHTWTLADPSDINSEGEVAAIDSIPSVPAGYYSRGEVGHYLTNGGKILHVVKFGRTSTAQDLINENTGSEGTPFEGLKSHFASIVATSDAPDVVAGDNFSTAVNFDFVRARTINDAHVLLIQGIRDNPRVIDFEMVASGTRYVGARLDGTDVKVFVGGIYQQANRWVFEILLTPYKGNLMEFLIRHRVTGATLDMFWDLTGTTNDSDFLGLPADTVTYGGIRGQHNYSNAGPAEIYYKLVYDTLGQFDVKGATPGWHATTKDLSGIDPGTWVVATDLAQGDTFFDSAVLDEADYSGLIL